MKTLMLLPPVAIARVGSAEEPVVNFEFELEDSPAGEPRRRQIVPAETIFVDRATGRVREIRLAREEELTFKDLADPRKIRPVAPFFEVWVQFDVDESPRILTQDDLDEKQLSVTWNVELANWKAFRRTQDPGDKIGARLSLHPHGIGEPQPLDGTAEEHFIPGASIPMGFFQTLLTDDDHREIRARFLPPQGRIYGPREIADPRIQQVLERSSPWVGHDDDSIPGNGPADYFPPRTIPWRTYAGEEFGGAGLSRGILDDMSDGIITVTVSGPGIEASAQARIVVGPPDYAPDRLQFRSLADDFEYFEFGPEVDEVVPDQHVVDLIEHALDNAEVIQLEWAKARSGWADNVPLEPDEAREVHIDMMADARELAQGNPTGVFVNRQRFLGAIRPPGSLEAGRKMPLFMVGQNRQPLWLNPRQYSKLERWTGQEPGAEPEPPEESGELDSAQAREEMLALIRKKRDEEGAARRHRRVRIAGDRRLSELFDNEEELLAYLLSADPVRNTIPGMEDLPLITPGDPQRSVFFQLLVDPDNGVMFGEFDDPEIAVVERWIKSLPG